MARAQRLDGVDLARALAVMGMLAAHLVWTDLLVWSEPSTWGGMVNGRSSILFAVLAGVSLALMTGGTRPRPALGVQRRRIAVRAGILWLIGVALVLTGVPVFVILPAYAVMFLLALPILGWSRTALWIAAAALALVMPWVYAWLNTLSVWSGPSGDLLFLAVGWAYPFPVWMAFIVAGLALGRTDLSEVRAPVVMLIGGALCAAVGYIAAGGDGYPAEGADAAGQILIAAPHSSGLWEVVGSGGFAVALLAGCLLLARTPFIRVLAPLRAVGRMPLTAYVGQLVAWVIIAAVLWGDPSDLAAMRAIEPFWPFVVCTIVFCAVWSLFFSRGPLESVLDALTRRWAPREDEPAAR